MTFGRILCRLTSTFRALNPLQLGRFYELELVLPTITALLWQPVFSRFPPCRQRTEAKEQAICLPPLAAADGGPFGWPYLAGQMVRIFFTWPFRLTGNSTPANLLMPSRVSTAARVHGRQ